MQWHTKHGMKLYGGWLGDNPDLNPYFSLKQSSYEAKEMWFWFYSKAWINRLLSLKENLYNFAKTSLQTHAEALKGGHWYPKKGTPSIEYILESYYVSFIEK